MIVYPPSSALCVRVCSLKLHQADFRLPHKQQIPPPVPDLCLAACVFAPLEVSFTARRYHSGYSLPGRFLLALPLSTLNTCKHPETHTHTRTHFRSSPAEMPPSAPKRFHVRRPRPGPVSKRGREERGPRLPPGKFAAGLAGAVLSVRLRGANDRRELPPIRNAISTRGTKGRARVRGAR